MFEYIKRVSIAVSYIANKIDDSGSKVRNVLESLSLDLLMLAQSFKEEKYKGDDLQKLVDKVHYLIDLIDYARLNGYVSHMNAQVFNDSQINFLKHIYNLMDQTSSLSIPLYHLKQLDEVVARKNAKENFQNKNIRNNFSGIRDFNFTQIPERGETIVSTLGKIEPEVKLSAKEEVNRTEPTKKIVEEVILTPKNSLENLEKEIGGRRERILKALMAGGGSIKEISSKMTDVSEKTIQRDLLELMRDKKVIMLGKKRWAKYYIK